MVRTNWLYKCTCLRVKNYYQFASARRDRTTCSRMLKLALILALALAMVQSSPISEEKQILRYENTILHKDSSAKLVQQVDRSVGVEKKKKLTELLDEINSYPEYEFAYGVRDPKTGDHKDQWEKRVGDHVQGVYMFEESDGTQRIVEYEADDKQGFHAKVTNVGHKHADLEGVVKSKGGGVATSYNMVNKKLN